MKRLLPFLLLLFTLCIFLIACKFELVDVNNKDTENTKTGIDLIDEHLDFFTNKRVGLITNPTGINKDYKSTIDVLYEKVNLSVLFAPEHGIRGDLQAGISIPSYIDEQTGLTVYSLYGNVSRPTAEMLENLDILCIDLQDVGARFYTYIYTMAYAMMACADYNKTFVVFDRPNPIGGTAVEGNILDLSFRSFIGYYPLVQRHGMTIGELALLFNKEYEINCDLKVIEMENWKRSMYFFETGLPWVIPSPNMPTPETALVYPGTCIFEGTNLSEGRGTTKPFQLIGAPYIDAYEYAEELNNLGLSGVYFRPAYFTPTFSKHTNSRCGGVEVHVTDKKTFLPVKTGFAMLEIVRRLYPNDFVILNATSSGCMLNLLVGNNFITRDIFSLNEQFSILGEDTKEFKTTRSKYLLY